MKLTNEHIEKLEAERENHLTNARLLKEEIDSARAVLLEEKTGIAVGSVVVDSRGKSWKISRIYTEKSGWIKAYGYQQHKDGAFSKHERDMFRYRFPD